jgi:dTDP-glucose 4,6-dehydratase
MCEYGQEFWPALQGQRIFLTGGTGFLGCWLLESFTAANQRYHLHAEITVLTRSPESFRSRCPHIAQDPAVSLLKGDVRSFPFPGGEYSHVIHAAADTGKARTADDQKSALNMLSTIFDGTRNTLEFAASHGARKLLMVSSGAVYGIQPSALSHIPESYLGGPDTCLVGSAYGEAKRAAEALCVAHSNTAGLECKIARCFAFVGPHIPLDGPFAFGNFIRSALTSTAIQICGDGTPLRSYLYATDLAVWLWAVLIKAPSLQPINIGSENPISIRELSEMVRGLLNPDLPIEILGSPLPNVPPPRYVPLVDLARNLLGLKQTVQLEEAIKRTAEWHGWKRN